MVIGKSFMMSEAEIKVNEQGGSIDSELTNLNDALKQVHESIKNDIETAKAKSQKTQVEIFNAHLNILQDPAIVDSAKKYISQGKSAGYWADFSSHANGYIANPTTAQSPILPTQSFVDQVLRVAGGLSTTPIEFETWGETIASDGFAYLDINESGSITSSDSLDFLKLYVFNIKT